MVKADVSVSVLFGGVDPVVSLTGMIEWLTTFSDVLTSLRALLIKFWLFVTSLMWR